MAEAEYLLDTNILVYLLRGASPTLRERIESFAPGQLVTSSIAYAEVLRGIDPADSDKVAAIERLFATIAILPFDRHAAVTYPAVPFKRGQFDRLIAAHALATRLTLVTNNEADFADVPGLPIENWTL